MATVALVAVAGYATAGWTGAGLVAAVAVTGAAAAAGSYIDQKYTYPALFGSPDNSYEGPKLDDRQIQTASYGSPIKRFAGAQNRAAGTVIYQAPPHLREERHRTDGGKGGGGDTGTTTYTYNVDLQIAIGKSITGREISAVKRVWADSKVVWTDDKAEKRARTGGTYKYYNRLAVRLGTADQEVDPLVESVKGVGNSPAYRGTAYITIRKLRLQHFGNRIPSFTFEVVESPSRTVRSVLSDLLISAGCTEDEFDVSQVSGGLRGMEIAGPNRVSQSIELLMKTYSIAVMKRDGKYVFIDEDLVPKIRVDEKEIGYLDGSSENGSFTTFTRNRRDIPGRVTVNFTNPLLDYQRDAEPYTRDGSGGVAHKITTLDLSLSSEEAQAFGKYELQEIAFRDRTHVCSLPPVYCGLLPEMRVQIGSRMMRATNVAVGADFRTELEADRTPWEAVEKPLLAALAGGATTIATSDLDAEQLEYLLLQLPPLTDEHAEVPGFYWGAKAFPSTRVFKGGTLYQVNEGVTEVYGNRSVNGGTRTVYKTQELGTTAEEIIYGTMTVAPGTVTDHLVIDNVNTLTVDLPLQVRLENATEAEMRLGMNRAAIGQGPWWEIIGFQTATDNADGTWTLGGLARGLRDTARHMNSHPNNSQFVLLNEGISFVQAKYSNVAEFKGSQNVRFHAVARSQDVPNAEGDEWTMEYATIRPFAPLEPLYTSDPDRGHVVSFLHHTRKVMPLFTEAGPPAAVDAPETYYLEIYDGDVDAPSSNALAVVRNEPGRREFVLDPNDSSTPALPWTYCRIRQFSDAYGLGNPWKGSISAT